MLGIVGAFGFCGWNADLAPHWNPGQLAEAGKEEPEW
jgi:nitrate reductase NapE component